jgi:hypothetical protein
MFFILHLHAVKTFSSFCESFYYFFLLIMFFSYFSIMFSIDGTSLKKKNHNTKTPQNK